MMTITNTVVLSLLVLFVSACGERETFTDMPPRPIAWVQLRASDAGATRHFSALTRAVERAPLSFQVAGRVKRVYVDIGQQVSRGDPMAEIDNRELQLVVEQYQSAMTEAKIVLEDANRTQARQESLYQRKLIAVAALDGATTRQQQAASRVEQLQAQLARANKQLDDSLLRAPYDGVISDRLIDAGQQVGVGQKAFQLEGKDGLEVEFLVPETLVNELRIGSQHAVVVSAVNALPLVATLTELGNHAQEAGSFPAILKILAPPAALKSGMSADVILTLPDQNQTTQEETVAIPLTAFTPEQGSTASAFVYDEITETVRRTAITITAVLDDHALVGSGLAVGDIVASKGVHYLRDGQKVTLLDSATRRFNP